VSEPKRLPTEGCPALVTPDRPFSPIDVMAVDMRVPFGLVPTATTDVPLALLSSIYNAPVDGTTYFHPYERGMKARVALRSRNLDSILQDVNFSRA
jgi:hypothetical protein